MHINLNGYSSESNQDHSEFPIVVQSLVGRGTSHTATFAPTGYVNAEIALKQLAPVGTVASHSLHKTLKQIRFSIPVVNGMDKRANNPYQHNVIIHLNSQNEATRKQILALTIDQTQATVIVSSNIVECSGLLSQTLHTP